VQTHTTSRRGIWLEHGQDNLITQFNISTHMYHDLSVSFYEHSTAFVNGTGKVGVCGGMHEAAGTRLLRVPWQARPQASALTC
jgi:hypothetical protein